MRNLSQNVIVDVDFIVRFVRPVPAHVCMHDCTYECIHASLILTHCEAFCLVLLFSSNRKNLQEIKR